MRGEAVSVDLGRAGILFALLRSTRDGEIWPSFVAHRAFARELGTVDMVNEEALTKLTRLNDAKALLATEDYPMLVRFRDIGNPKSVEAVDPADLAASFGPKVRLKRITVQITDDKAMRAIEKQLGWLRDHHGSLVYDGRLHHDHPEKDVTKSAFVQGDER